MRAIGSNGGLGLFARAVVFGLAAMLPKSAGAETIIFQGILSAGSAPFATLWSQPFPAGTKLVVTAHSIRARPINGVPALTFTPRRRLYLPSALEPDRK